MASTHPAPVTHRTGSLNLRRTGSLIVVGAVAAAVAGCAGGVPNRLDFSDTEKVKVTEIVVSGGSGDVVIRTAAIAETRIKRMVRYRNAEPGPTYRLDGTVLHVDTDCGDNCNVSYDIEAPTGVAVTGELGSGDVTVTNVASTDLMVNSGDVTVKGATGAVKLETHSGDIDVRDVHGATQLTASSGNITGTNLGGAALAADVTSGDIDLRLSKPGPATVKATSGDVSLMVPDGSYQVRASVSSGDKNVTVPNDPAATNLLDVRATSGNLTIGRG
jgi:hypothetical protein